MRPSHLLCVLWLLGGCSERSALPGEVASGTSVQGSGPDGLLPTVPEVEARPLDPGAVRAAVGVEPLKPPPLSCSISSSSAPSGAQSVSEVRWIDLYLSIAGTAASEVNLEIVAPSGAIYERRAADLSGSAFDEQQLHFDLPVAGTVIDSANLHGSWIARCEIEGATRSTHHFELKP